jgi:hypothetical protein
MDRISYATTCYRLNVAAEGEGGLPTVTPSRSATCPLNYYVPGDAISVHAFPANGWRMAAWRGVADPTNSSTDSTLTMPASDHTVTAIYAQAPSAVTGDAYEDDNMCTQAQIIHPDGVSQRRSIDQPGDEDWVRFATTVGVRYRIEVTIPFGSPVAFFAEDDRNLVSQPKLLVVSNGDRIFLPLIAQ